MRNEVETAQGDIPFDDEPWQRIFAEVDAFVQDAHVDEHDVECTLDKARSEFLSGDAAMFRATPEVIEGTTLSKAWVGAIKGGQQPAKPETYIALAG